MIPKMIKFSIPYDTALSKNAKFVGKTKKVLNPKYVRAKLDLSYAVLEKAKGKNYQDKVDCNLIISIYSHDKRADGHNFLEALFDGIEYGLKLAGCPVNDRYYNHFTFDRSVSKDDPRIEVTFWQ